MNAYTSKEEGLIMAMNEVVVFTPLDEAAMHRLVDLELSRLIEVTRAD